MNKQVRRKPAPRKKVNKNLRRIAEIVVICLIIFAIFSARAAYDSIFSKNSTKIEDSSNGAQMPPAATTVVATSKQEKYNNEQMTGAINNVLAAYETKYTKSKIAVIYHDLKTGYRYGHNDQEYFSVASTAKVIYAIDAYNRVANGELDPTTPLTYKASFAAKGNGHITNNPKKNTYDLETVLMNMITFSDNTATNILFQGSNEATLNAVNRVYANLGINTDQILLESNKMAPESIEKVWLYLYKNQDKYPELLQYLKNTQASAWIKQGIPGKTIASKYGQIPNYSNDTSIVYGEKGDYLLLIFTESLPNPTIALPDIASQIDKLHEDRKQ